MQAVRDGVTDRARGERVQELERLTLRVAVMHEICRELAPYRTDETATISGQTVLYKDLSIDSLAVMDIILNLEDRFDVAIPINVVAEIHTADQLADAILIQRTRH